jgi:hypothetical protein
VFLHFIDTHGKGFHIDFQPKGAAKAAGFSEYILLFIERFENGFGEGI